MLLFSTIVYFYEGKKSVTITHGNGKSFLFIGNTKKHGGLGINTLI